MIALLWLGAAGLGTIAVVFAAWHLIGRAHERRCTDHKRDAQWWKQCRAPFALWSGQRCWSCYTAEAKQMRRVA